MTSCNSQSKRIGIQVILLVLLGLFLLIPRAHAAGPDSNPVTHWDTRYNYFLRFPAAAQHGIAHRFNPQKGSDVVVNQKSMGPGMVPHSMTGPIFAWPVTVPAIASPVPTMRDMAISQNLFQTFGYPVSDTQFQIIERYNHNRFLEQLYDPEKVMWMSTSVAGIMANSAGNSLANMGVNQCINAIDYVRQPLRNFTAEFANPWQTIRYELFIPMAVLLLLPGAVLAQVRAIVAQGSSILGDVSPFEGLVRSVIATFLIPGSFLVINYGIDVSNSLTITIANEYQRMFGSNMYEDAKCAIIRAMPVNDPNSNNNAIIPGKTPPTIKKDVWSPYESTSLATRLKDPCAGVDQSRLPDEDVNTAMMINRCLFNSTLSGLGLTWNIYCAFQMVFMYYLWCMGPIAAALWVWPVPRLRQAFGNWVEGVIIICFWALFWNTSIFLLAAFKGVGDTGTVYTCALVFLCVQSVKNAFDFVSLVSSAAAGAESFAKSAAGQITDMAKGGGKGGGGGGGGGARGGGGGGGKPSAKNKPVGMKEAPQGSAGAISSASSSPVSRGGLSQNLSIPNAPMSIPTSGGGSGGGSGSSGSGSGGSSASGPGSSGSGSAGSSGGSGPGGSGGPGTAGSAGQGGGAGEGPGGGKGESGLPPQAGGGAGGPGEAGKGATDAVSASIGGMLGGKGGGGGGGGGAGSSSSLSASFALSKNVFGGDADLSSSLSNVADNMANNLSALGLPPLAGDMLANTAVGAAGAALFGDNLGMPGGSLENKALTAMGMLSSGPEALINGQIPGLSGSPDRNPLAKDLALDQMFASGSQRDILSNGIDADVAGNPQAELARSFTQDLMTATGVGDDALDAALAGDQTSIDGIKNRLGVSPMTLELARGGDPGAASIVMEAAGRNALAHASHGDQLPLSMLSQAGADGNLAAQEALNVANIPMSGEALSQRQQLVTQAAMLNDPDAARQLLAHNGEHVVAAMSASHTVSQELAQSGVSREQFQRALGGDTQAQQAISQTMGGVSFDKVQAAYYGDTGDAATTMVSRGNAEIRDMQAQGKTPAEIQQYARENGDVSMLAAQSVQQSVSQGSYERALAGDQGAQREIQTAIGSSATLLAQVHSGSDHARLAVQGATGQDAQVMSAASYNTQAVLTQMSGGDGRAVEQALSGSPQQREAYVQQMSNELGVSPRVLSGALAGGSLESGTVLARAGQIAEYGVQGGSQVQLSEPQHRLAEGLQSQSSLMQAAQATYHAAQTQGDQVLSFAAQGSSSHALALGGAIQSSQELRQQATPESGSIIGATSTVTQSAGDALSNFTVGNPTAALHNASLTAQSTLRDCGIDPQAVVQAYNRGDSTGVTQAAMALNVSNDVVQGALIRGDSGDAMTMVAAHGRQIMAQGPEAVQRASYTESGQLALHVAQSVPQNTLNDAMGGNNMAQAQIAQSVSSDPQVLMAAANSQHAMTAVGSTLGDRAYSAVAASASAQEMLRLHPDSNLVSSALYAEGREQQSAMSHLARDMNVSPNVLTNALCGSTRDLSTVVTASSAGLHMAQEGYSGSQYFNNLAEVHRQGENPMTQAIQAASYGQNLQTVQLASQGASGAQEAVRATMEVNPQLSRLVHDGSHAASAIMTAASTPVVGEVIRDIGVVAAAGSIISHNLRPSDANYGIDANAHRQAVSGYDRFVQSGQSVPQEPRFDAEQFSRSSAESGPDRFAPREHGRGADQAPRSAEPVMREGGGMAGTEAIARPQPADSHSHKPSSDQVAQAPSQGGFFDQQQGKRPDAANQNQAAKVDGPQGTPPAVVPGQPQNRNLAPQAWQGPQRQQAMQAMQQLQAKAKLAREANNIEEYEAVQKEIDDLRKRLGL